jgi:hypothetical protein
MFLILELNKDGGTYLQSTEIPIYIIENRKEKLSKDDASLISLIIAHWVCLTACCPEAQLILLLPELDEA